MAIDRRLLAVRRLVEAASTADIAIPEIVQFAVAAAGYHISQAFLAAVAVQQPSLPERAAVVPCMDAE